MIPAIKESNQLKAFLGFKEHYPEFYNECMDSIGGMGGLSLRNKESDEANKSGDPRVMPYSSLKEFTINKNQDNALD